MILGQDYSGMADYSAGKVIQGLKDIMTPPSGHTELGCCYVSRVDFGDPADGICTELTPFLNDRYQPHRRLPEKLVSGMITL